MKALWAILICATIAGGAFAVVRKLDETRRIEAAGHHPTVYKAHVFAPDCDFGPRCQEKENRGREAMRLAMEKASAESHRRFVESLAKDHDRHYRFHKFTTDQGPETDCDCGSICDKKERAGMAENAKLLDK